MDLSLIEIVDYATTQAYRFEDNFDTREQAIRVILRENLIRNGLKELTFDTPFAAMCFDILEDIEVWEESEVYQESRDSGLTLVKD